MQLVWGLPPNSQEQPNGPAPLYASIRTRPLNLASAGRRMMVFDRITEAQS